MSALPAFADYVIVGAGSAGCVLANRLSADPRNRVLLVEAGPDHPPGTEPEHIADSFPRAATPDSLWPDLLAERATGTSPRPFDQARIVGGGSSVMGMLALRGLPDDYDEWRADGAEGWGWDDVLPYFRRLERDLDFAGELHGSDGPIPIRRHMPESWPPFCRAMTAALQAQGLPLLADLNAEFGDGVGAVPMSNSETRRVSASMAYLPADVRARPNLHIAAMREVSAIVLEGRRANGIRIGAGNDAITVKAGEVILSAGAIQSPALLLASGIGPGAVLREAGIAVVAERAGVGANLQNHPVVALSAHLRRAAIQSPAVRPAFQNCVRYSSGQKNCAAGDMFMTILNKTALHPLGARIGGVLVAVYKSYSRGSVTLTRTGSDLRARVRFNLLSDPRDLERQVAGVRLACEMLISDPVKKVAANGFVPTRHAIIRRLGRGDTLATVMSRTAAVLLDGPATLRQLLIDQVGVPIGRLPSDDEGLARFVLAHAAPVGHVAGTCRIGRAQDETAVVDPRCRVIGVDALRVVDCSVMPTLVRANTNIPAIMIAEKAADLIRRDAA